MNCPNTGPDNRQFATSIGREMAVGAALGVKGGVPGALVGVGIAGVQNVAFGLIDHGPVNVPMRPSHIGQSGTDHGSILPACAAVFSGRYRDGQART